MVRGAAVATDGRHTCPAPGCSASLPLHRFACLPHWRTLPGYLRHGLTIAWNDGDPNDDYGWIRERCIHELDRLADTKRGRRA